MLLNGLRRTEGVLGYFLPQCPPLRDEKIIQRVAARLTQSIEVF